MEPVAAGDHPEDRPGLPRYREDADTFVLSGAEDLVTVLVEAEGWARHQDESSHPGFVVERYRPRVEGLFARIERWTATAGGEVHWRSVTHESVTTVYGRTADSRIADRLTRAACSAG